MNASRPGTATPQHISYLRQTLPYKPDLVILLYVFNDIDYLASLVPERFQTGRSRHSRFHPASILYHNSYLFQEALVRVSPLYYADGPPPASFGELGTGYPYVYPNLVRRHLQDLNVFVESVRQSGAAVGIVPFELDWLLGGALLKRYQRFLEQAQQHELPVWEVTDALRRHRRNDLILNRFDPHPNEDANRLAASSVARRISGNLRRNRRL